MNTNFVKYGLLLTLSVVGAGLASAKADADVSVNTSGSIKIPSRELNLVDGSAISCAYTKIGETSTPPPSTPNQSSQNQRITLENSSPVGACSDKTRVGKAMAIGSQTTQEIGKVYNDTFGKIDNNSPPNPDNFNLTQGRNLIYNRSIVENIKQYFEQNSSTQDLILKATANPESYGKSVRVESSQYITKEEETDEFNFDKGGIEQQKDQLTPIVFNTRIVSSPFFGVAISHDPLTFAPASTLTSPTTLDIIIGSDLTLQADSPGDFASVIYEIGTDRSNDFTSFKIDIDFETTSLDNAITCLVYNPATPNEPCSASDSIALNNLLLPYLNFDPDLHLLTAISDIPIFQVEISPNDAPVTVTYNTVLIGGNGGVASVPEPASALSLLALGTIGVGSALKRQQKSKLTHK